MFSSVGDTLEQVLRALHTHRPTDLESKRYTERENFERQHVSKKICISWVKSGGSKDNEYDGAAPSS